MENSGILLSKMIRNNCQTVLVSIQNVQEYHLYDDINHLYLDIDKAVNDLHRIKRLLIKLDNSRGHKPQLSEPSA